MEQHPIPRQITTFEFKLIGFMTLKQFLYLVAFIPTAFVVWKLVPIPFLNLLCGILIAAIGVAVAFVPINDRPMDVWLKNFLKRITSPTQYLYHKENSRLDFLKDLYFVSDPHKVLSHIETEEKLKAYLQQTKAKSKPAEEHNVKNKQDIQTLLNTTHITLPRPTTAAQPSSPIPSQTPPTPAFQPQPSPAIPTTSITPATPAAPQSIPSPTMIYRAQQTPMNHPFMTGVVKNSRQIPLPGILVYIKDATSKPLRLLKTNPHGIFATFNPLPPGDYEIEMKDPNGGYFFDRMKVTISGNQLPSYEFYSKEIL